MKKIAFIIAVIFASFIYAPTSSAITFDEDGVAPGYRGFVDFGYTLGVGDFGKNVDRVSLTTSHGYQIIPQLFAGVGVGVNYFYDEEAFGLPIFAHFRSDILNNDITPFVELKVGYSLLDVKGFYLNPAIGCRFSVSDNIALNLSLGYTVQKADYVYFGKQNCGGLDFRFGIDF